jgi:hypothetical protein
MSKEVQCALYKTGCSILKVGDPESKNVYIKFVPRYTENGTVYATYCVPVGDKVVMSGITYSIEDSVPVIKEEDLLAVAAELVAEHILRPIPKEKLIGLAVKLYGLDGARTSDFFPVEVAA